MSTSKERVGLEDALEIRELTFEWAMGYDTKDWARQKRILAPRLNIDYSWITGHVFENATPDNWIKFCSNTKFLGDPLLSTQHLLGGSTLVKISDTEVTAHYQIRAAHIRWADSTQKMEVVKGHGHGEMIFDFIKIEGVWKLSGFRPGMGWNEYKFPELIQMGLNLPGPELSGYTSIRKT